MATKQQGPFWETDFTKIMGDFKVPGIDMDQMMHAHKKNLDAVQEANKLAFEGLQAVASRQAEVLKTTMEATQKVMKDLMAQDAPEEKLTKQVEAVKASFDKMLANMKEMSEIVAKSNTDAADVLYARISASLEEIKGLAKK